jgi:hypothetical protein
MGELSFPEQVALLVDKHIVRRHRIDSLVPLTETLGCRTLEPNGRWHERVLEQPRLEHEPLVRTTMVKALIMHMDLDPAAHVHYNDVLSLADGLVKKHRWQECLTSIEGAYALADALLQLSISEFQDSRDDIEPALCALLNEWIRPSVSWTAYPDTPELLRVLFGNAWYDLTLAFEDLDEWGLLELVHQARPLFSPGVLPEYLLQEDMVLPPMGQG